MQEKMLQSEEYESRNREVRCSSLLCTTVVLWSNQIINIFREMRLKYVEVTCLGLKNIGNIQINKLKKIRINKQCK